MEVWPKKIGESDTGWRLEDFRAATSIRNTLPEGRYVLGVENSFGTKATLYLGRTVHEFNEVIVSATSLFIDPRFKCIDLEQSVEQQYYSSSGIPSDFQELLAGHQQPPDRDTTINTAQNCNPLNP